MNKPSNPGAAATRAEPMPATRAGGVLVQLPLVFMVLGGVVVWQWDVVHHIYLRNQINEVGWAINGGILLLFFCGIGGLLARFFEYRGEEGDLARFQRNLREDRQPLLGLGRNCMVATRYRTLRDLSRNHAAINHNALAATLLATEASRNSFLKFVHNVLILTGVFGTIVSLSLALLGASDMIHGGGQLGQLDDNGASARGLGTMIFGMSTALSTTMTAILAYLVFGYFYIKLTDTQTYLISRVEELTTTTLLPPLQGQTGGMERDYAAGIRGIEKLIARFESTQREYESAARVITEATKSLQEFLSEHYAAGARVNDDDLRAMLTRLGELQQQSASENRELLSEVVQLLQEGFRLGR